MKELIYEGNITIFVDSFDAPGFFPDLFLERSPVGLQEEGIDDWFIHFDHQKQQVNKFAVKIVLIYPVIHSETVDSFDEEFEVVGVYSVHLVVYDTMK